MDRASNTPNFCREGGDGIRAPDDQFPSFSDLLLSNQTAVRSSMRRDPGENSEQLLQECIQNLSEKKQAADQTQPIRHRQSDNRETPMESLHVSGGGETGENGQSTHGSSNIGPTTSQLNFMGKNQTAAEDEPPQNTEAAAQNARKRANDKKYRDQKKENEKRMRSKLEILEPQIEGFKNENQQLKNEVKLLRLMLDMKTKEADDLRNSCEDWKNMCQKDRERNRELNSSLQALAAKIDSSKDKSVEFLELLVKLVKTSENRRSETRSDVQSLQPGPTFTSEIDSTTQLPVD